MNSNSQPLRARSTITLPTRGASFFTDIVDGTKLLRARLKKSLAELVANGLVISDSFAGLRALLTPSSRKTQAAARRKHRQADLRNVERRTLVIAATRVRQTSSRLRRTKSATPKLPKRSRAYCSSATASFSNACSNAKASLCRGVCCLRIYHRLEARGELRGGRFVAGISGEQFALPEAVGMLRAIRRARTGAMDFGFRSPAPGESTAEPSLTVGPLPRDLQRNNSG